MAHRFAVSFDYRCPFARNAHEAVVRGEGEGRDWDVRYLAFSLDQVHVPDGEPPIWKRPADQRGTGVLALQWGVAVRDAFADAFAAFHVGAFAARHDHGQKLADESVLRDTATAAGLDPDAVAAEVASGRPLATVAAEHIEAVKKWNMFGVPTFVVGDRAVFVRLMERDVPDDVDRVLDLLEFERLNELKYTRIPR
ncbi:MAG: DsbA family protein [Actinomycetota bacterium]